MNDNGIFSELVAYMKHSWPQISGAILAVLIAYGRMIHDGGAEKKGEWVEGLLCGLLTLAVTSGLDYFGLPVSISPAIGGGIGFIGVRRLRAIAIRRLRDKNNG